jgi:hypothetical protein
MDLEPNHDTQRDPIAKREQARRRELYECSRPRLGRREDWEGGRPQIGRKEDWTWD